MNEAVIREKLMEIAEAVEADHNDSKSRANEGLYVPENGLTLESAVDQLRMNVKYLMFDLEASRRENRYLRQMLEMRPPQARGRDDSDSNNNWR
jgi:hypothetical protein